MRKVRIGLENCKKKKKHFQEELTVVVAQKILWEMGIKICLQNCHDSADKADKLHKISPKSKF